MFSIKRRLMTGLFLLLGFWAIQTAVFHYSETRVQSNLDSAIRKNTQVSSLLANASVFAQKVRRFEKEYFIFALDIQARSVYMAEWNGAVQKLESLLTELHENKARLLPPSEAEPIRDWLDALSFYKSEMQKIFVDVNQRNSEKNIEAAIKSTANSTAKNTALAPDANLLNTTAINARIGPGKDRYTAVLVKGLTDLSAIKTEETLSLTQMVNQGFNQLSFVFTALTSVGMLIIVFLLLTLPRAISAPLGELSEAVDLMSKGNVKQPAPQTNVKEFAVLTAALERLRASQATLLARLGR